MNERAVLLRGGVSTLADELVSLAVQDDPVPPDQEPAPSPVPLPPGSPFLIRRGPAPRPTVGTGARSVYFNHYSGGGRYSRNQRIVTMPNESCPGCKADLGETHQTICETRQAGQPFTRDFAILPFGNADDAMLGDTYRLLTNDRDERDASGQLVWKERDVVSGMAGKQRGYFLLDLRLFDDHQWLILDIAGGHPDEVIFPFVVFVNRSGTKPAPQTKMPLHSGNWDIRHEYLPFYFGWVPTTFTPGSFPLPARECPHFSDTLTRSQIVRTNILPVRGNNDIHRPNVSKDGLMSTFNKHSYYRYDMLKKYPQFPLLDGPRGTGAIRMCTHIMVGRKGSAYFLEPWRFGKVELDGTVRTFAGWRHNNIGNYWQEYESLSGHSNMKIVGDWSAIPPERHGFHETWGGAWVKKSLAIDESAAPIDGDKPHLGVGPKFLVADSQNNRIVAVQFDGRNRETEAVVTEAITGLFDPWDLVEDDRDDIVYISERTAHRISAWVWDAATDKYKFLRVVVQGSPLATVNKVREMSSSLSFAELRADLCVGPEGMFIQDRWLYYGSGVAAQVRRVNLDTEENQVVATHPRYWYSKIALSDGTFGPRGTVMVWTWAQNFNGLPYIFVPDGAGGYRDWNFRSFYPISGGLSPRGWDGMGYTSVGGVGLGRLYISGSQEGLAMYSKALESDQLVDADKYIAGETEFKGKGYHLIYGNHGYGFHNFALPWGESEPMDYYLAWNGHAKP